MTLGARGGGFGSIGQGPFRTGQGGFGQYLIGDDGASLDQLRLTSATIGWGNGTVTDDDYLATLEWYLGRQEKGTTQFLRAKDDLDDARYSIGRNRIVNEVNRAASTDQRVASLTRLMRYDQRRLRGMRDDNEQARELRARISEAESQVRDARYGDQVRAYNDHRRTTDQMLAHARRMAAEAQGAPDEAQWADRVSEWEDRRWDERFDDAKAAYERARGTPNGDIKGAGDALVAMLEARLARMGEGTPGRKQYERALRDQRQAITEDVWARRAANMETALREGQASNEDYIAFLHERVAAMPKGSVARQQARSELLSETFRIGNERVEEQLASGSLEPEDAIDFYQGYLATMQPTSAKYVEVLDRIRRLRVAAVGEVPITAPAERTGLGRRIAPSGGPGGVGFVSQYDGSPFAMQNCLFAASAMMVDALGGPAVSGADLRHYAGDTDGPGFQNDIQASYEQLGLAVDRYNGMGFRRFVKRLETSEGGAVVIGMLSMLPPEYRITGSGAHGVYVTTQTRTSGGETYRLVMDPLGRAGYRGDWWPDSVLQRFAWSGVRNPLSGNAIYGSVIFGKRSGRSNVRYQRRPAGHVPAFQAFDTDRDGRSTVGRGGGTSRAEAGRPADWRKGRAGRMAGRRGGALTDTDADAFLEAVLKVDRGPHMGVDGRDDRGTPQEQHARAKELLARHGGDVRLATLEWFGMPVETDTSLWGQKERWYVNSVATRLGYEKVPVQGIGVIGQGKPPAPKGVDVIPGLEATKPHSRRPDAGDVSPAAGAVAAELAERLGWPPTPEMERAIIAWLVTEGGDTIEGNNPFRVTTDGQHDLVGQLGTADDGRAIFDTMGHGVDAVADELEREFPDVVAAGRSGDPRRLLKELDRSGYREGGYGNALIPAYNAQPGQFTMISEAGLLDVPPNLGRLSGQHGDIAELFDIDPNDPAQMGWLEENLAAAKAALDAGSSTWRFVTLAGTAVRLDFSPDMYAQLASTRADYADIQAESSPDPRTRVGLRKAARGFRDAALGAAADVAMGWLDRELGSLEAYRDDALRTGDYPGAMNAAEAVIDRVGAILGVPPGEVVDVDRMRGTVPGLDQDDYDRLARIVDSYDPDSAEGDPLLKMALDKRVVVERDRDGRVTAVTVPPESTFVMQRPDGTVRLVTDRTDPDMFAPVTQYDEDGNPHQVPKYATTMVQVSLTRPDGGVVTVRIPREQGQVPAAVFDYAGYRPPPDPRAMARQQQSGGGWLEGTVLDTVGDVWGAVGAIFGSSPVQRPEAPTPEAPPPARGPWDAMRVTLTSQLPVQRVTYIDPVSDETYDFYSLDGQTWRGGERDRLTSNPPRLVLNEGSGVVVMPPRTPRDEPTFRIAGKDYTLASLPEGTIEGAFHWEGSDPRDEPNPAAAPRQPHIMTIQGTPAPGGGMSLDVATDTRTERERAYDRAIRSGSRSFARLQVMDRAIVEAAEREGRDPRAALRERDAIYAMPRVGEVPRIPARPRVGWGAIASRLGATASSANANQVAASAARSRAVLAAAERRQALEAAERRMAAKATPRPSPRPTPKPTPVGSKAPELPTATPRPSPRPTPKPTPVGSKAPELPTATRPKPATGLARYSVVNREPQPKPAPRGSGIGPRRL